MQNISPIAYYYVLHYYQTIISTKHLSSASPCESLPPSWQEITTETVFPILSGDEVTLKCSAGYKLRGDTTVTCVQGTEFSFSNIPACAPGTMVT